jgi:hypothetical protein
MSELKVNKVTPRSGTTVTLGDSGDTITIPSGAIITNNGTATGFGKVLQVVNATDSGERTTTSVTFVTASNTLSVAITPSSASNKVLILVSTSTGNTTSAQHTYSTIYRGATNLGTSNGMNTTYHDANSDIYVPNHMSYLDSPNTTSATTYQFYFRVSGGTGKMNSSGTKGSITLLEIAG